MIIFLFVIASPDYHFLSPTFTRTPDIRSVFIFRESLSDCINRGIKSHSNRLLGTHTDATTAAFAVLRDARAVLGQFDRACETDFQTRATRNAFFANRDCKAGQTVNIGVEAAHLFAYADANVAAAVTTEAHVHHVMKIDAPNPCIDGIVNDKRNKSHSEGPFSMGDCFIGRNLSGKRRMDVGDSLAAQEQAAEIVGICDTVLSATAHALVHNGDTVRPLDNWL
jgi:hypothetical protein